MEANKEVPLLPALGQSVGQGAVKPGHTFVVLFTIQKGLSTIASEVSKLNPDNAAFYRKNARKQPLQFCFK